MEAASPPGTPENPLRVAIIGAGPAGFYAADHLLRQEQLVVSVDLYDRLLTPFGLVRHGVAPDHLKIKTVTKAFSQTASHPRCRFFGNVDFGTGITLDFLREHYHLALFSTGAQTDRRMGIPGEDLRGSHPATAFVAWYNGHPDYARESFDLSQESAIIVGVGNVAIDVARILCLTPEELHATDMPEYAVRALNQSRVRDVYLIGRRGPAQAAFTNPELKELGDLAEADILVRPDEATLDRLSREELEASGDRMLAKKVDLIHEYAARKPDGRPRRLHLRFLVSPAELMDDGSGQVSAVRIVRNELVKSETGTLSARPTEEFETIPAGLVFRSVGYRGVSLSGVPFNDRWGTIANAEGRVIEPESSEPVVGLYAAGWIKRGPSGVIGTNKPDALETVTAMLEDAAAGKTWQPEAPSPEAVSNALRSHGVAFTTFEDWCALDSAELAAGERCGRPRVKFGSRDEMLRCLAGEDGPATA